MADGTLCTLDGHTRLYEALRRGVRTAMVFDSSQPDELRAVTAEFVREARRRGIYHIQDMALYSPEEQSEKWHDWCDAFFAARQEAE